MRPAEALFKLARARPKQTAERLIEMARERLPEGYDVETHFRPAYNPWDQRLCLVPDDDLFEAIKAGKASVVTDTIDTVTEKGVLLKSGKELEADIIITATGLALEWLGGANVFVDGEKIDISKTLTYRGMMYSGAPNLVSVFGYLNASWTLRADLISEYVCRLLNYMGRHGYAEARPVNHDPAMPLEPYADFSSGYIMRALDRLPKQGRAPWRHPQDYARDVFAMRYGRIDDGVMEFRKLARADALTVRGTRAAAA